MAVRDDHGEPWLVVPLLSVPAVLLSRQRRYRFVSIDAPGPCPAAFPIQHPFTSGCRTHRRPTLPGRGISPFPYTRPSVVVSEKAAHKQDCVPDGCLCAAGRDVCLGGRRDEKPELCLASLVSVFEFPVVVSACIDETDSLGVGIVYGTTFTILYAPSLSTAVAVLTYLIDRAFSPRSGAHKISDATSESSHTRSSSGLPSSHTSMPS